MTSLCSKFSQLLLALSLAVVLPTPATAGAAFDRITSEKLIRLGIRTDAPPFASVKDGQPKGFSVDLCGLIAGAILATTEIESLDGKFITVDTDERFEALQEGKIDVLCGATTATLKRREMVSFSIPTFSTGIGAVVSKDAPDPVKQVLIAGEAGTLSKAALNAALADKAIGVRANTTAADWVAKGPLGKIAGLTLRPAGDHAAGLAEVANGSTVAYFADQAILMGLLRGAANRDDFEVSRLTFTTEPYALALPRGDEDLRLVIDRALSFLYRKGAIFEVYARHFGKPNAEAVLFYKVVALPE